MSGEICESAASDIIGGRAANTLAGDGDQSVAPSQVLTLMLQQFPLRAVTRARP